MMTKSLYNIGIGIYYLFIRLFSLFNTKARLWISGRYNWKNTYAKDWKSINPEGKSCVWVHCASLGEFEQGRPVIERLKRELPEIKILLTFFSPSGYEIRKNYGQADYVCYLPLDTHHNALIFVEIFKPTLTIFVKYEFWLHFLNTLYQKQIPTLLISAVFRENQIFFKWYGALFRKMLKEFNCIFTQNKNSTNLLQNIGLQNVLLTGDTRIDRVMQIAQEAPEFPIIEAFAKAKKILIIGSSWQPDEAILLPFINEKLPSDWKVIIAPHQIGEHHINQIEQALKIDYIRYSKADINSMSNVKTLVIDNVGMLAALYRYGHLAYIGGGFGSGIHNTLEPIAFGLPVIFGPKYQKFEEANRLVQSGGAFMIQNSEHFKLVFKHLQNVDNHQIASNHARQYVHENQGATDQIIAYLRSNFLHTKV